MSQYLEFLRYPFLSGALKYMVNGYTFSGSTSAIFILPLFSMWGKLLICYFAPLRTNDFLLETVQFWKGFAAQESKQEVTKSSPFVKQQKNVEICLYHPQTSPTLHMEFSVALPPCDLYSVSELAIVS